MGVLNAAESRDWLKMKRACRGGLALIQAHITSGTVVVGGGSGWGAEGALG